MKNPTPGMDTGRTGGRDLLRGHDFGYIYRGLWRFLSHYKLLLIAAVLLTALSSILSISGTGLAGSAIGAIAGESDRTVWYYLLRMVIFYVLSALISYTLHVLMIRLSQKIVHKMRTDVFNNLARLPVGFFDRRQAGELVSTITYDINTVGESLSGDFLQIISSVSTVVYSFVLMLTVSPTLILVFLVTIPLSVLSTAVISRVVRPLFRRRSATLAEMNGYAEEMVAGLTTIKTYAVEEEILAGFDEKNNAASGAYRDAEANGTMAGPSVNFINNLSLALVNVFGAILHLGNPAGFTLTSLSKFVLLSRKFSGPINQISNIYADIQSALAAAERVFRLMDEVPEPEDDPDPVIPEKVEGRVEFSHVRFGYDASRVILSDLSFVAPPGSVTAIVGPTGAGKTTVINLLMRFYDIGGGEITVDGTDIRRMRRADLRHLFTMVLQDTWLFSGTVYENVAYGAENVTRGDVERVCRAAGMHHYIMSLPQGYDTPLDGAGVNISGGQRQLLTIARAMLIDSPMLILDEATSHVDSKTESDISAAMVRLMQGKTCFVIAHRLSTIRNADRILVMQAGDVVEQGTHDELLALGGAYAGLYHAQFETETEERKFDR